jgi:predicted CxxxxCH...CXXCH cytochrome family protein
LVDAIKATPGVGGNSHSWDVSATNTTYETVAPPPTTAMGKRLPDGNIICSTCHNQHSNDVGSPYLRVDNTGDAMCKVCHTARDVGIYTDAPATNKGSHPVGINYTYVDGSKLNVSPTNTQLVGGKVECSSCHGVHDVQTPSVNNLTTDGNLLRTPNTADAALCKDCHVDMTHNGMNCLDCHQVHNTDKSNLYMIKSTITTPSDGDKAVVFTSLTGANNFADGDGIDGVCEVCHKTTKHFRNSDNLAGVPDQLHTSQGVNISDRNCTECHEHGNSFAGGDCVTCHQDNTTYPYLTGNWNISDAHVSHTTKYNYDCSTCHFNRGSGSNPDTHIDGTVDININPNGLATRNGQDGNTPAWDGTTCSNIYCHTNGKTADRGTDGTFTWGAKSGAGLPFGGTTRPAPYDVLDESQPNNYATQVIPNWDGGSITACTDCHGGLASLPPDPYDITDAGPYQATVLADFPYTGGHGPITTQHFSGNEANWGGGTTQCFWCHDVDDRTAAGGVKKQGTYGTSFHVDGETRFRIGWTTQGGTGNVSVPRLETSGHCSGKTCWSGG